jgi:proteasome lid subunit RPN8/RPN11
MIDFSQNPDLILAIQEHAQRDLPRESCGLIQVHKGRMVYVPCGNAAEGLGHFEIAHMEMQEAEDRGEVLAIVHSHPYASPEPSDADRVGCELSGLLWVIVNAPVGHFLQIEPSGWEAPLIGRQFHHGVLDCFTLIKDWYLRERGIELPDFEREDDWWNKGQDLYKDNFAKAGFHQVPAEDMQPGDVILMHHNAHVMNHGAVYLGDGMILHHLSGRLSSRDLYGPYFQKITEKIVRHGVPDAH